MGFQHYSGPANKFPGKDQWKDFKHIFDLNKPEMGKTGNTADDINHIWSGVSKVAKEEGVEERVIFCIIMQESTGNVGVRTTTNMDGHGTAGLMQCDGSPGFPGRHGLSQDEITSMIRAGTKHFKANLAENGNKRDAECIYKSFRCYNSGSCNPNNLSDGKGATNDYVSDMANRLCGRLPY